MTHVIAQPCIGTKDKACVTVCPVNCVYEGADQFFIKPDECIDCGLCVDACPVEAVFSEEQVPTEWSYFIDKARQHFGMNTADEGDNSASQ